MKRIANFIIIVVYCAALFEIFGFAAAYILGVSDKTVAQMLTGGNTFEVKTTGCTTGYSNYYYPHPFLAYVHDPNCASVNNIGLFNHDVPAPNSNVFVVGIFGGSVAAQFAGFAGPAEFEQLLNKCYANKKGQRFLVLNFAEGGWKQPQQVIALMLFGKYVDLAVSIEGYNETTYGLLHANGAIFSAPADNYIAVNPVLNHGYPAKNALALFISHVEHNSVLNRSNGLKVLILGARSLVQKTYGIGLTASTVTYRDPWENTIENELRDYARYLRQFAAIAASDHIDYYFVLQPSAAYKELSEEEKRVVTHADYKRQYDLVDAMFYKTAGDHYLSLKDLFQHESRQIFYDDAHMNLARHLAYGGKEISYGQQKVAEKLARFLTEKGAIMRAACAD